MPCVLEASFLNISESCILNKKTAVIIQGFIRFGEHLLRDKGQANPYEVLAFLNDLQEYNDDPSISESRPFFFVSTRDGTFALERQVIESILMEADSRGVADQFKNTVNRRGEFVLYFSHMARTFATEMAKLHALSIANVGANGLCLDSFISQGLFTISEEDLINDIGVARILIQ